VTSALDSTPARLRPGRPASASERAGRRRRRASAQAAAASLALALALAPADAIAQAPPEHPYAGDLWSRPRLTGDWFGVRDLMARHGVAIDLDWSQILQGVGSGGLDTDVGYGGLVDYRLKVDTGKLGLWPGGFLDVHAMSSYGTSVNGEAGASVPVNGATIFPSLRIDEPATALMKLAYFQHVAKWLAVYAGKIETLEADPNEFAHDFRTQFLNLGMQFNLAAALAPISAWGGGVLVVPFAGATLSFNVLDPNGTPLDNDLAGVFDGGVTLGGEGRVTVKPFGLAGHQLVGFLWSNLDRPSLRQDPSNLARLFLRNRFPRLNDPGPVLRRILERFFPALLTPVEPLARQGDAWTVYYNFDQYLWSPPGDPSRGVGVFFRFGVSDGLANPVKYAFNVGIGGKGVVPGRPHDTFGIGWSRIEFSDHLAPFLRQALDLGLEREDAVEAYYNIAVTPWLGVTLDLQVVEPGLKKVLGPGGRLEDVDTAVVGGLRAFVRF
jgi:porin